MKHLRIANLLERRIQEGDYALSEIPAERELADEIGTSRVTLRKAIEELEVRGLVARAPNRRLVLTPEARAGVGGLEIAFISPSMGPTSFSPDLQLWLAAVDTVARRRGDRVRIVNYRHWADPILTESMRSFDGVFLVTSSEPIPAWTAELLAGVESVVALSEDLTNFDLPSVVLFPPRLIDSMMSRLKGLGHRRIDCINVQGHNTITQARIDQWGCWLRSEEVGGNLVDQPCSVDENIFEVGVEVARKWIKQLDRNTRAVLCVTLPAAMGVIRAAAEVGISIGDELSVCTVDCEGIGKFMNPPIASFERPDPVEYMNHCMDWFAAKGSIENWRGPLLMQPSDLSIFDGGSIGPPPKTS